MNSGLRSLLYWIARVMGDFNALMNGTVGRRILRRQAGKKVSKWLGKL